MKLFTENYFFLTSYPKLVSGDELFKYLTDSGSTYKIIYKGKLIGLAYYKAFNPYYVFLKFMVKQGEAPKHLVFQSFKHFISIIRENIETVLRLETIVFAFDRTDRAFIRKAGFKYEIEKKMDIFKGNRFWSSLVYSLIGEEIDEFLLKGDKNGQ